MTLWYSNSKTMVTIITNKLLILSSTTYGRTRVRPTDVTREEHFPLLNSNSHNLLTYLLDITIDIR